MPATHDALLQRTTFEESASGFDPPELRELPYQAGVGVCEADEARSAAEEDFLDRLRQTLGFSAAAIEPVRAQADALAAEPIAAADDAPAAQGSEVDRMIVRYSILNGALELLPQTQATMSVILPLRKKVCRIGENYGFELDRWHIAELLATVGLGLGSQALDRVGRRLVGGLLGRVGGSLVGRLGSTATGSAFSFATTWAPGQVAERYYAGGRTLDAQRLKESIHSLLGEARTFEARYLPEIGELARTIDPRAVLDMVRRLV